MGSIYITLDGLLDLPTFNGFTLLCSLPAGPSFSAASSGGLLFKRSLRRYGCGLLWRAWAGALTLFSPEILFTVVNPYRRILFYG